MYKHPVLKILFAAIVYGSAVQADAVDDVEKAAMASFESMPRVQTVSEMPGQCGADANVNRYVAYCTSPNIILVTGEARVLPETAYLVAHAYGHAVQVRHGVADFALSQIRSRRGEEQMLRGLVERQVDCIAGFLVSRSGVHSEDISELFDEDPLDDVHWGRNPLRIGPSISVELAERERWFQIGLNGDLSACAPGEFTSDLLLRALRF